ncbi:hypothetical protein ACLBWP_16015 [Microbacterium sp. M1A1_1b]
MPAQNQPNGQPPFQPNGQPPLPQNSQPYQPGGQPPYQPQPPTPPTGQSRGKRVLISVVSIVVAIVVAVLVRQGFNAAFGESKQDIVNEGVKQIKEQTDLPKQVDSVTTWTGVSAEDGTIHYRYTVQADPSQLDESALHDSVLRQLCSTTETKKLLDRDIAMRYSYGFDGSSKKVDMTFTKADC